MKYGFLNRVRLLHCILIAIGIFAFLLALYLPVVSTAPAINLGEELMEKILEQVLAGKSRQEIMNSLATEEKELLKKYEIDWLESVPIITELGQLKPTYLPFDHVVVYGTPEFKWRKEKRYSDAYMNAVGKEVSTGGDNYSLDKLIRTTHYGTNEILKGSILNLSEIPNQDQFYEVMLLQYLILKKWMTQSPDCLQFTLESARKDTRPLFTSMEGYVERLLRLSIKSPLLPEDIFNWSEVAFEEWEKWYNKNADNIEITNEFLFE